MPGKNNSAKGKKRVKRMKAWNGWAAVYRRGGRVCEVFHHRDSAMAFIGSGRILRIARVSVRELARGKRR